MIDVVLAAAPGGFSDDLARLAVSTLYSKLVSGRGRYEKNSYEFYSKLGINLIGI